MSGTPSPPFSRVPTQQLIAGMLKDREGVSDLIFSPGRPPQIEVKGELIELRFQGLERLSTQQTQEISEDLIGANAVAAEQLRQQGSTDLSYSLSGVARFRVNIFRQRSTYAVVMRVIPTRIPTFAEL